MFINEKICKKCGGKCCKSYPGIALPKDFGNSKEEILQKLTQALKSGKWTIDWNDRKKEEYFVRPAVKGKENFIFDHSISGECVFLTKSGCKLKYNERPSGCLLLEPKSNEKCIQHLSKRQAIEDWSKYKDIIIEAAINAEEIEGDLIWKNL